VEKRLRKYHDDCGGFGTFLLVGGKNWTTKENRARSLRRFMGEVAPQLADL
jgi:hypothetical protein